MAGFEEGNEMRDFADVIKRQIKALRKQLSAEFAGHTPNTTQLGVVSPFDCSGRPDSCLANEGRIWGAGETFDRLQGPADYPCLACRGGIRTEG